VDTCGDDDVVFVVDVVLGSFFFSTGLGDLENNGTVGRMAGGVSMMMMMMMMT